MHLVPDTIAIYARISKDDARSEGGSVESQIARCHQRLASMGVLEHELSRVRVFRDDGYSGKSTDRPAFQELQRAIHDGSVKVLVFSELSRISRDLRGFLDVSDLWRSKDLRLGRSLRTPAVRVGALRDRVRLRTKVSAPSPTPRALLTAADAHAAATRWRALMERRGLSQAELAAEVGVTPARVSQLLTLLRVDASRLEGISIKAGLRLVR